MQVSVGGNDIALAPAPCTILHMLIGICCTPTAGIDKVREASVKCVVKDHLRLCVVKTDATNETIHPLTILIKRSIHQLH